MCRRAILSSLLIELGSGYISVEHVPRPLLGSSLSPLLVKYVQSDSLQGALRQTQAALRCETSPGPQKARETRGGCLYDSTTLSFLSSALWIFATADFGGNFNRSTWTF